MCALLTILGLALFILSGCLWVYFEHLQARRRIAERCLRELEDGALGVCRSLAGWAAHADLDGAPEIRAIAEQAMDVLADAP